MPIAVIDELTSEPLPPGSNIMVVYDPASYWFHAALTMAAGWLRELGKVRYMVATQPADNVRLRLGRLGVDTQDIENEERLIIRDFYSATLGMKSKEKHATDSLKVHEWSPSFAQELKDAELALLWTDTLRIADDYSYLDRFNAERIWVEYIVNRVVPQGRHTGARNLSGFMKDAHSTWAYRTLEVAHDGIIDFKIDELSDPPKNLMRIRSMRNVGFDAKWHQLKITKDFEVKLSD